MALITLKDVTIAFEGVVAVNGANLSIEKGDYLVIVGENGSGKSTIIRAILGLVRPQKGRVSYGDGLKKNQIGYLPQQTIAQRDFPASVEEVVLSGCIARMGQRIFISPAQKQLAEEKMRLLDIDRIRKQSYRTLSGGQQQRVLLARALCATDSILLLDEPVTGLDPEATAEFYSIVRKLNREYGVAIVMVSHDLHGSMRDASKVLVMNHGVDFLGTVTDYETKFKRRVSG